MYVVRRGDRFWFRKAVPVDLVDVLGIAEVRRSLRTGSAREARRRALDVLVRVEEVYAVLRSERPMRPARDIALALLEKALQSNSGTPAMFETNGQLLQEAAGVLRRTGDGDLSVGRKNGIADLDDQNTFPAGEPISFVGTDDALRMLRAEGPKGEENRIAIAILEAVARMSLGRLKDTNHGARDLDTALSALSALREGAIAPEAAFPFEQLRALLTSHFPPAAPTLDAQAVREMVAAELRDGIARAEAEKWSGMLLSEAIAKFEAVEVCMRGGQKHQEDVPRRLANFMSVVGDKPIRDVSRNDVRRYRDLLDQLPDRFVLRFNTSDMQEAIKANRERRYPYGAIKKPTIDLKYLGPVNRLFAFLVKEKLLGANPLDGIRSTQKEESSAKAKRLPLKPHHIDLLFAETARQPVITATYWVPVIMLFSGARPGELAQLKVEDLRERFNGRPHLSVLCQEDDNEEEPDVEIVRKPAVEDIRRVKTEAGRRLIPVHPVLVRMGLLDLFQRRRRDVGAKGQLFKDVKPNAHGHYSAALTKRINRRLRALGITNKRFVLYSLRHNFIEACNASGMPLGTRNKVVGHQSEGMGGIYGNPLPEPWESDWIEKVTHAGINLEPYLSTGTAGRVAAPGKRRKPMI